MFSKLELQQYDNEINNIIDIVSDFSGVCKDFIISKKRDEHIIEARHIAILNCMNKFPNRVISDKFQIDRTSIPHILNKYNNKANFKNVYDRFITFKNKNYGKGINIEGN